MAIVTLEGGWGDGLIRHHVDANFQSILTSDDSLRNSISTSSIASVAGKGKTEFRHVCNSNMAAVHAAYSTSYASILEGESWSLMREKMNANFILFTAALELSSPSASPSATPSTSPSEGTPSSSPSEGTPSDTPSGSPSEGTPSNS